MFGRCKTISIIYPISSYSSIITIPHGLPFSQFTSASLDELLTLTLQFNPYHRSNPLIPFKSSSGPLNNAYPSNTISPYDPSNITPSTKPHGTHTTKYKYKSVIVKLSWHIQKLPNQIHSNNTSPLRNVLYNNSIDNLPFVLLACLALLADYQLKHQPPINFHINDNSQTYTIPNTINFQQYKLHQKLKSFTPFKSSIRHLIIIYSTNIIPPHDPQNITHATTSYGPYTIKNPSTTLILTNHQWKHQSPMKKFTLITSTTLDESQTHTTITITKTLIYIISWHIYIQLYKILRLIINRHTTPNSKYIFVHQQLHQLSMESFIYGIQMKILLSNSLLDLL